jgi:hypothetical protein
VEAVRRLAVPIVMPNRSRLARIAKFTALAGLLLLGAGLATESRAGVHLVQNGTFDKIATLCFVGDALTSRPERVAAILDTIKDFEAAGNLRFKYIGSCPPSKPKADGTDVFDGDIRIVLARTNVDLAPHKPPPGKGCGQNPVGSGDWGASPNSRSTDWRSCLYNVKLTVERPSRGKPYRNQILHEIGHAIGLSHEHERVDVDFTLCHERYFGGSLTGYVTTYDSYSVMHYEFLPCGIDGNYSYSGLSEKDRLSVHILYPENDRIASFLGMTVVRENEPFWLTAEWKARGAYMPNVVKSAHWTVDGKTVSEKPDLLITLPAGVHSFVYTFRDFLDRDYVQQGTLRVLSDADFLNRIVAPVAATSVLQ